MQGIGYKELIPMVKGLCSTEAAAELVKRNTRHYAKRQWTWFRGENDIQWLDILDGSARDMAMATAIRFLAAHGGGRREQ